MRTNGSVFFFEPPDEPHSVARDFIPERLTLARELAGLTKTELATRVERKPASISQFESEAGPHPSAATLAQLALVLQVPLKFFATPLPPARIAFEDCHFRARRSVSQFRRRQAISHGRVLLDLVNILRQEFDLPVESVSNAKAAAQDARSIEEAALAVRKAWGMGLGPVSSIRDHLESRGVLVLPLAANCAEVDAFSCWAHGFPVIFSAPKCSSRTQFDLAHELGHLILHEEATAGEPELEREANAFAASFLLPEHSFRRECPNRWDYGAFLELKGRWRVSIQALLHRAHDLGKITPASYRYACVQLSPIRRNEPAEWVEEASGLVIQAVQELERAGEFRRLASQMGLSEARLSEWLLPLRSAGSRKEEVVESEDQLTHWT